MEQLDCGKNDDIVAENLEHISVGLSNILAKDFFISELTTDLKEDEIIKSFNFPKIKNNYGWSFEEIVQRSGDFALFSAGSIIEIDHNIIVNSKLCVGGAGETPIRLSNIEALIKGKNIESNCLKARSEQLHRGAIQLNIETSLKTIEWMTNRGWHRSKHDREQP